MPHLSQLQRDNKDKGFTVVSVTSPAENNTLEAIQAMVEDKGDGMGFTVAADDGRKTNEAWMQASGQRGIPASFLVDKAGKIAWIGHPMGADLPLAMILDGSWDYVEGPATMKKIEDTRRSIEGIAAEKPAKALQMIDDLYKAYPLIAGSMDSMAFTILANLPDRAADFAKLAGKLLDQAIEEKNVSSLNRMAWGLVDPENDVEERHLDIALRAAKAAVKFSGGEDAAILDTLARTHFWRGDLDKALEIQRKAVTHASKRMKPSLVTAVAEYEKAIAKEKVGAGK